VRRAIGAVIVVALLLYSATSCQEANEVSGGASLGLGTQAPTAPDNLSAVAVSSTEIRLSWDDNADNEEGFEIERRSENETDFSPLDAVGADIVQYTDTGLSADTTYFYRVNAVNSRGSSGYSNIVSATTEPLVPSAPDNLVATPVSLSEIRLTWDDNSDNETGFEIERMSENETDFSPLDAVGEDIVQYTDTGLSSDTTYFYRIYATSPVGDSEHSNVASATTNTPGNGTIRVEIQ
jgi:type 1 fimbria pilin